MKLKGTWDPDTTYDIGDVVAHEDGFVYHLRNACPAGVTPVDTLYWSRLDQFLAQAALFVLDGIGMKISDDAIALKGDDGNNYLITIDTSGDEPEVIATAEE